MPYVRQATENGFTLLTWLSETSALNEPQTGQQTSVLTSDAASLLIL